MDYFTPLYYLAAIVGVMSVSALAYAIWDELQSRKQQRQRRSRRGTPRRRGPPHIRD